MDGITTHWLADLVGGRVIVQPCCEAMSDCLDTYGYTAATGRPLSDVLSELSNGEW